MCLRLHRRGFDKNIALLKMKYSELEQWMKKSALTRKELAAKCGVSPKTVEGWRARGELPKYASAAIERLMSDIVEIRLSLQDFRKLMAHMDALGIKSIDEYVVLAVREKYSCASKKKNS